MWRFYLREDGVVEFKARIAVFVNAVVRNAGQYNPHFYPCAVLEHVDVPRLVLDREVQRRALGSALAEIIPVAEDVPRCIRKLARPTAGSVEAVAVIMMPVFDGTVVRVLA